MKRLSLSRRARPGSRSRCWFRGVYARTGLVVVDVRLARQQPHARPAPPLFPIQLNHTHNTPHHANTTGGSPTLLWMLFHAPSPPFSAYTQHNSQLPTYYLAVDVGLEGRHPVGHGILDGPLHVLELLLHPPLHILRDPCCLAWAAWQVGGVYRCC